MNHLITLDYSCSHIELPLCLNEPDILRSISPAETLRISSSLASIVTQLFGRVRLWVMGVQRGKGYDYDNGRMILKVY